MKAKYDARLLFDKESENNKTRTLIGNIGKVTDKPTEAQFQLIKDIIGKYELYIKTLKEKEKFIDLNNYTHDFKKGTILKVKE